MTVHVPHPLIAARKERRPAQTAHEHIGFNGWLALRITQVVGSMWCAYAFGVLAMFSLPQAIQGGTGTLVGWIAQTFLQLVLLSVIMVGQKVSSAASDKQALHTYEDAEALLEIADAIHGLTKEVHVAVVKIEEAA
jgi:hypothetical protein